MRRFAGNRSHAARALGISRSYLIQKCQQYGLDVTTDGARAKA